MTAKHALLLKGFVLAHNPPAEITAAIDAIINAFPEMGGGNVIAEKSLQIIGVIPISDSEAESESKPKPEKKRHNWSPEARAAQAERMRARQAAGLMTKGKSEGATAAKAPAPVAQKTFTPVAADKLISDHSGYAGKRDPHQPLLDSDWPDINNMLNVKRMSVSKIASDYDVTFGVLRAFIDKHEVLEEEALGEAQAPSDRGA